MAKYGKHGAMLIIDDDEFNRAVLENIFEEDYEILEAENGKDALAILSVLPERPAAILLDMRMPVMGGGEFAARLAENGVMNDVPVFIVTAEPDAPETEKMYDLGVMDIIAKPVVPYVVRRRVASVVELFESRRLLSDTVERQSQELVKSAQDLVEMTEGVIEALAAAIELRSGETGEHVRNIRRITELLLEDPAFGADYTPEERHSIALASMLHDVGKISVPDTVLKKPGRFTEEDRLEMQKHSVYGARVLERIPQIRNTAFYPFAVDIALHHHERWDGSGYPDGLRGTEISAPSRIVGLADAYDALICKRCYKESFSRAEALRMIADGECGAFDPQLTEAFVRAEPAIWSALYERG